MFKTVKSKVAMIYMGLVVIIILLGVISLFSMTQIGRTIDGLIATNYNSIIRISEMRESLMLQDKAAYSRLYGHSETAATEFENLTDRFLETYEAERATIVIEEEKDYITEILETYTDYTRLFETLQGYDLDSKEAFDRAALFYNNDMLAQKNRVFKALSKLFVSNERALFERQSQAASNAKGSLLALAVIFPSAALGGFWISFLYTKRFFAPLYDITQSIRRVREGNLGNSKTTIYSEDEFGMLADEFNNMTMRLYEFEKSAMGSIQNERTKSDSIVRSIKEPLILLDRNGVISLINEAFAGLFGLDADTAEGLKLGKAVKHDIFVKYIQGYLGSAGVDEPQTPNMTITISPNGDSERHNDDSLFYHVAITPVLKNDEELGGIIVVLHNITEMKLLEKARTDFIATVSHEFKTPLTSIVMGADLISGEKYGELGRDQKEIMDTIREDGQRLGVLVGEMLELSKIESSKAFYNLRPCDLKKVIENSVQQFTAQAERNQIKMTVRHDSNLPFIKVDFSKITWVLNNLLSNAMKYTKEGDSISVKASVRGEGRNQEVMVSVSDTGIGVPPEYVSQIFEKFVQIKSYDIEVRGSGVGLAVSKEIITAHGGQIWCESQESSGSTFIFTLPAYEA